MASGTMTRSGVMRMEVVVFSTRDLSILPLSSPPAPSPFSTSSPSEEDEDVQLSLPACFPSPIPLTLAPRQPSQAPPVSPAVHQYVGYRLCRLFTTKLLPNVVALHTHTSGNRYQPRLSTVGSTAARRAVAPAGGYIDFVRVMTAEAAPTERAPASHRKEEKCGERCRSLVVDMPVRAARMWPRMVLRGCARGDSMVLYSRIAAAPYFGRRVSGAVEVRGEGGEVEWGGEGMKGTYE